MKRRVFVGRAKPQKPKAGVIPTRRMRALDGEISPRDYWVGVLG